MNNEKHRKFGHTFNTSIGSSKTVISPEYVEKEIIKKQAKVKLMLNNITDRYKSNTQSMYDAKKYVETINKRLNEAEDKLKTKDLEASVGILLNVCEKIGYLACKARIKSI